MRVLALLTLVAALANAGCTQPNDDVYSLYRNSVLDPTMRIHVATFDSSEGGDIRAAYKRLNCEEAAQLYLANDGEQKRWWCEPGRAPRR